MAEQLSEMRIKQDEHSRILTVHTELITRQMNLPADVVTEMRGMREPEEKTNRRLEAIEVKLDAVADFGHRITTLEDVAFRRPS